MDCATLFSGIPGLIGAQHIAHANNIAPCEDCGCICGVSSNFTSKSDCLEMLADVGKCGMCFAISCLTVVTSSFTRVNIDFFGLFSTTSFRFDSFPLSLAKNALSMFEGNDVGLELLVSCAVVLEYDPCWEA